VWQLPDRLAPGRGEKKKKRRLSLLGFGFLIWISLDLNFDEKMDPENSKSLVAPHSPLSSNANFLRKDAGDLKNCYQVSSLYSQARSPFFAPIHAGWQEKFQSSSEIFCHLINMLLS
jgi:hypothetical protein